IHAMKVGVGEPSISAGVEPVIRFTIGNSDRIPGEDLTNPLFADAQARTERFAEGEQSWHDPREDGNLPDVYIAMGQTAENVQQKLGMSRQEQDEFGGRSQNLAESASAVGFWCKDITPVTTADGPTD